MVPWKNEGRITAPQVALKEGNGYLPLAGLGSGFASGVGSGSGAGAVSGAGAPGISTTVTEPSFAAISNSGYVFRSSGTLCGSFDGLTKISDLSLSVKRYVCLVMINITASYTPSQ